MMLWKHYIVPNSADAVSNDLALANGRAHLAWTDLTKTHYAAVNTTTWKANEEEDEIAEHFEVGPKAATAESLRPAIAVLPGGKGLAMAYGKPPYGEHKDVWLKSKRLGKPWGDPVHVGAGWQIALAVDSAGYNHIVYGVGGPLQYARFYPMGGLISTSTLTTLGHGPRILALGQDEVLVAWEYRLTTPGNPSVISYTTLTQGSRGPVENLTDPKKESAMNVDLALDPQGRICYAWERRAGASTSVMYWREGLDTPVRLSLPNERALNPSLAFHGNDICCAYTNWLPGGSHRIVLYHAGLREKVSGGMLATCRVLGEQVFVAHRSNKPIALWLSYAKL